MSRAMSVVPVKPNSSDEAVVLLHGIARTSRSMLKMEHALQAKGFATLNPTYGSRRKPLQALVEEIHPWIAAFAATTSGSLHFVTHSMGGLLARAYICRHRPDRLGRVVMLGPPNAGSEIADLLAGSYPYRKVFGPAGAQLTTQQGLALCALLGTIDYPVGVIAGDRSLDPVAYWLLPGANDGRVAVARTRIDGITDHLTLHVTHTLMVRSPKVIRQTIAFLRQGRFERAYLSPTTKTRLNG
jgi:hypothetical protein